MTWEHAMLAAQQTGVKVSKLPHFWTRFISGFDPGWHVWIDPHLWGTVNGAWTIMHELVHHEEYERIGHFSFWLRYIFSPRWRVRLEIEAYKTEMAEAYQRYGCVPFWTQEWIIRSLKSATYWWYGRLAPTTRWVEQAAREVEGNVALR